MHYLTLNGVMFFLIILMIQNSDQKRNQHQNKIKSEDSSEYIDAEDYQDIAKFNDKKLNSESFNEKTASTIQLNSKILKRILCEQKKMYQRQKSELNKSIQKITQNLNDWKEEQTKLLNQFETKTLRSKKTDYLEESKENTAEIEINELWETDSQEESSEEKKNVREERIKNKTPENNNENLENKSSKAECREINYTYDPEVGCYRLYVTKKTDWFDASNVCKSDNADLASITTKNETEFLLKLLEKPISFVWLGVKSDNDVWKTIHDEIYDLTNPDLWFNGKVHTPTPNQCLTFFKNSSEHGLRGVECDAGYRNFLCAESNSTKTNQTTMIAKSNKSNASSEAEQKLLCESSNNYTFTPKIGCHKLYNVNKTNWFKAQRICKDDDTDLAVVDTIEEKELLMKMMEKESISSAWLGVKSYKNTWVTVNKEIYNVNSNLWLQKRDDRTPENDLCRYLITNSTIQLGYTDCYKKKINGYFCEKNLL